MTDHDAGAPVPFPTARYDDPHMADMAKHPARTEKLIALILLVGIAGVAGFGAAYWVNAKPWVIAVTLGVGLFALGFGMAAWGKYLMPQGPFVEERHVLASSEDARRAMAAAVVERSKIAFGRRKLLGGLAGGGLGIFSIVAIFPLLRSLGPVPKNEFDVTNWKAGLRLVDATGKPIHKDDLVVGGIQTVFPEGFSDTDTAVSIDQTVLIRISTISTFPATPTKGFTTGPFGYVAYSKLCTHLGCPVGLYEQELELLVCPCHQSMFNIRDGAVPQFGPAPRPLPELPLAVDSSGYLIAKAGYDQAVGPGFWERSNVPSTKSPGKA